MLVGSKKALNNRTVVVTRPRRQAQALAKQLERAGARIVFASMIKIAPPRSYAALDAALRRLLDFDALVFSSRNAVERFFARAKAAGPRRVFAVGPETARALRERGLKPRPLPKKFDGMSLARAMGNVRGLRVLIPRSAIGRDELPRALERKGARVTCVEAYRTVADAAGVRRLRSATGKRIDAVTFTSPSTVEHFVAALGLSKARRLLQGAAAISIGPVTSAALRRKGLRPAVQARAATAREMVAGLKRYFLEAA